MLFPEVADQINGIFPEVSGNYQIPGGDSKAVTLYGLRHTSTDVDDQDKSHGWINSPLNANGMKEASNLAQKMKEIVPTRIVSSDLQRAIMTANAISKETGVPVEPDPRLRALNTGIYAGLNAKLVHKELEPYFANQDMRIPGGETVREFHDRTISAVKDALGQANNGDKVVIMGHSTTPRILKAWASKEQVRPLSSDEIGGVNKSGDVPLVNVFKYHAESNKLQKV